MKINRRQRQAPGSTGDFVTDDLDGEAGDEVEAARADPVVDPDGMAPVDDLDSEDLDGDGLGRPLPRRGRRGAATLAEAPVARPRPAVGGAPGSTRTTPRQFLHEVNVEMRKVAWPTRKETFNYASVVLVTLAVLMALIFGLDYVFNRLSIYLFK